MWLRELKPLISEDRADVIADALSEVVPTTIIEVQIQSIVAIILRRRPIVIV